MLQAPLALLLFLVVCSVGAVLAVSRRAAAAAGWDGMPVWAYAIWLTGSVFGAIVVLAAVAPQALFVTWIVWLLWMHLGFAAELKASWVRRRLGFLFVYGALLAVTLYHLALEGLLRGTAASAHLALGGQVVAMHAAVPPASLLGPEAGAVATRTVGRMVGAAFDPLALTLALSVFAYVAFALSFLKTERGGLRVGISLLPKPRWAASVIALLAIAALSLEQNDLPGAVGLKWCLIVLVPLLVAEGLAFIYRALSPLRTRGGLTVLVGAGAIVLPPLALVVAALGWAGTLLRVDELQPLLLPLRGMRRPRLTGLVGGAAASSVVLLAVGAAEQQWLRSSAPHLADGAAACASLEMEATPEGDAVRYSTDSENFTMDRSATPLGLDESPASVCRARGKRACHSEEWHLACLCAYANESERGLKLFSNEALLFRVVRESGDRASADPNELLTGSAELVRAGQSGQWLLTGAGTTLASDWMIDCRYRGRVDLASLPQPAYEHLAVRCCE